MECGHPFSFGAYSSLQTVLSEIYMRCFKNILTLRAPEFVKTLRIGCIDMQTDVVKCRFHNWRVMFAGT